MFIVMSRIEAETVTVNRRAFDNRVFDQTGSDHLLKLEEAEGVVQAARRQRGGAQKAICTLKYG